MSSLYAQLKPDAVAAVRCAAQPAHLRPAESPTPQLLSVVRRLARAGVGDGDYIALICGNTVEFVEVRWPRSIARAKA